MSGDVGQEWGVWDQHERVWVSHGHPNEKEAWRALLDAAAPYPWELTLAKGDGETPPKKIGTPRVERCEKCRGDGECWECGQTCPECDGAGEFEAVNEA